MQQQPGRHDAKKTLSGGKAPHFLKNQFPTIMMVSITKPFLR